MSIYQNQKTTKPKPEDVAGGSLSTEKTVAILNLVDFIRVNKVGIQWGSGNSWALSYKGKRLGYLKICIEKPNTSNYGSWLFFHNRAYLNRYYKMDECDLKTIIFEHIYAKTCGNCFTSGNKNAQKAGYMNPTDCGCYPLRIFNPDGEALEYTKQLIEYRKICILEDSK